MSINSAVTYISFKSFAQYLCKKRLKANVSATSRMFDQDLAARLLCCSHLFETNDKVACKGCIYCTQPFIVSRCIIIPPSSICARPCPICDQSFAQFAKIVCRLDVCVFCLPVLFIQPMRLARGQAPSFVRE